MPHGPNAAGRATTRVRTIARAAALGACLVLVAACGSKAPVRQIALTECRVPKLATAAQCGKVEVPEDRARPAGRTLAIAVVVLPAATLSPQSDPLIMLPGGPGQSSDALAPLAGALGGVRRNRDIVLIDPRGTGKSAPLRCPALAPRDAFDELVEEQTIAIAAQRCIAELRASGDADPAQYTTSAVVADIDAVRIALGYDRINLWGGSYGTRVAQEYLRRYPQHVRSIVLDGVAPPAMRIGFDPWLTGEAALDQVIAACAASPACRQAYPDLDATLARIRADLAQARTVTVADPRTGAERTFRPSFDMVIGALQGLVYAPESASMIPALLSRAAAGDYVPMTAAAMLLSDDVAKTVNLALHFAVTCAEDAPRIDAAETDRTLARLRAPALARRDLAACDGWPRPPVPVDFYAPVVSDKPVLILSGGLDPVTPPAAGDEVARTLSHGRHIVAGGYGHIVSPHACAPRLIEKFVEEAGFATLPSSCAAYFAASARPPLYSSVLEAR
ncbi:MAG TPA: alpha/beta fold hydrolase [Casimicrobiaceae bacterium]|nr:alpha/beta fold hydrolase [Casimicrobiaceae bacterium]